MSRITEYDPLTAADPADWLPVVDVSDTSMDPTGTTKRISAAALTRVPLPVRVTR